MNERILVIDDEESIRFTFESFLLEEGYEVATAADYDQALEQIGEGGFDLVFADILLGGRSGIDLLRELRERQIDAPVVMVTGFPNIETASEAVRLGAFDYLSKPVTQEALLRVARMALEFRRLSEEKASTQANLEAIFRSVRDGIVTVDREMGLLSCNESAGRLCGLGSDAVGQSFRQLAGGCSGRCLEALEATLAGEKRVERPRFECGGRGGRVPKVLSLCASPLRDGRGTTSGAVLVIRDETRLDELERDLRERSTFHRIIGHSQRMQEIYSLLEKLADVPTTVLVTGESGTGKELVAEALHHMGRRSGKPLVKVNCAALSENLLESELFGHVKGAFTGATHDKAGRFQVASGGTIFLDEIGDISPGLQVRLLRVLQEKTVERVGSATSIPVDVRVVAATNRDLAARVRRGEFREDLFYRLKVVRVELPPLKERRADIPLLVDHFLEKFNRKLHRQVTGVSEEVRRFFMAYPWPGNIRELENTLEHAFILSTGGVISREHLPADLAGTLPALGASSGDNEAREIEAIRHALGQAGGNKAKAARLLGVSRRTIYRKIETYRIEST